VYIIVDMICIAPSTTFPAEPPTTKSPTDVMMEKTDQVVRGIGGKVGVPAWGMYAIGIGQFNIYIYSDIE
jgi:hypothetical protein